MEGMAIFRDAVASRYKPFLTNPLELLSEDDDERCQSQEGTDNAGPLIFASSSINLHSHHFTMVTKPTKTKTPTPTDKGSSLNVLNALEVDQVISQLDLELALESQRKVFTAFSAHDDSNNIQVPHRSTLTTSTQNTLVMPSRAGELVGCKFVGVPNEGSDGLSGTTVVLDDKTGKVKGLLNARKLTALRNACGSALSLRALPPKREPRNLLIFGSGAQAYAHATVFLVLFASLESCTFIVRESTPRSEALLSDLKAQFPRITLTTGSSEDTSFNLTQAVHNANIILTLVPTTTPLFNSVDVTSGTHLVLVGSYKPEMRDVDDDLIRRGSTIIVDSKEACLKEAGEIISAGLQSEDMVELGALLGDDGEDLRTVGDVTIFKSVGLGIQDISIASLILEQAEKMGLGTIIENYD